MWLLCVPQGCASWTLGPQDGNVLAGGTFKRRDLRGTGCGSPEMSPSPRPQELLEEACCKEGARPSAPL